MTETQKQWLRVGTRAELQFAPHCVITIANREIALFDTDSGLRALDNSCPHQGGPLAEGDVFDGAVTCPWHSWSFSLETGQCDLPNGPSVATYAVREVNGVIEVEMEPAG